MDVDVDGPGTAVSDARRPSSNELSVSWSMLETMCASEPIPNLQVDSLEAQCLSGCQDVRVTRPSKKISERRRPASQRKCLDEWIGYRNPCTLSTSNEGATYLSLIPLPRSRKLNIRQHSKYVCVHGRLSGVHFAVKFASCLLSSLPRRSTDCLRAFSRSCASLAVHLSLLSSTLISAPCAGGRAYTSRFILTSIHG